MKVSVAMATYNGAKYLRKQLDSVLNQTLAPDEVIVTDDNSTDGTINILKEYQEQGSLRFVVNVNQLGVAKNFQKAVSMTKPGNFVALCDQDDEWIPEKLEQSAQRLKAINDNTVPCMVYSDLIFVDEYDTVISPSFRDLLGHNKYHHNLETLLRANFVNGCTVLMNSQAKAEFLKMPDGVRSHDEWLALAVYSFGKGEYLRNSMVRYKRHDANFSISVNDDLPNKYYANYVSLLKALRGKDDFLTEQIGAVRQFYELNDNRLTEENKRIFSRFLKLSNRSYLAKKLNYMLIVRRNKF
ncbi:glycosyltransferase family 2 protein [Mucilaginibacter ginkgonis]|uniref:Glycosyltransferase family 2 protein n=1 Tax=Mucilaginibacter ginkgonis TaxID=2682091 RepID=A0A6I4I4K8_9SPHI|nr:glycosyltransferase family 2 protein [Mucilaginibacter ginkgonis]QQL50866.1 glycosyltransferase family 2 protein [Mucilaginibacter ginkgonis]